MRTNAKQSHLLWCYPCQRDVAIYARGKETATAFQSVYSSSALSTYNKARCDINLPGRLDWVKFVSSSRPIPSGLVVS